MPKFKSLKVEAMDRISQLPQPVLHQILCHLSPKQALRTCTLSKSWRYVGSTRPKVELRASFFKGNLESFMSVLDNTLQRYHDQNLSVQDFLLDVSYHMNSDIVSLLEKWVPILVMSMRVKTFNLTFVRIYFDLPSIVLQAESLEELYLGNCRLTRIGRTDTILLNRLRTLSLTGVCVFDKTLERIISNCPSIEHVTLIRCNALETIKLNKVPNLKHFVYVNGSEVCLSIEIEAPRIEYISITGRGNWIHATNHLPFTHLRSLYLRDVHLFKNSFHCFSDYFCCLEDLTLDYCYGFEEFNLKSRSVKNLSLNLYNNFNIDIDAPNIHCFELSCSFLPLISFTTTSSEWKSKINIFTSRLYNTGSLTSMLLQIYELHNAAFSHSEFSLHIEDPSEFVWRNDDDAVFLYSPAVIIESLSMRVKRYSSPFVGAFLSLLFCFFHPRNIEQTWCANYMENMLERKADRLDECLPGILVDEKVDFEEVRIESSKENGEKTECGLSYNQSEKICFRLKWGELSFLQA